MHLTSGTHRGEPLSSTSRSGKQLGGASPSLAVHQDVRRRSPTSIRSLCRRRRTLVCFTFFLACSHPNSLQTLAPANFLTVDGGHLKPRRVVPELRLDDWCIPDKGIGLSCPQSPPAIHSLAPELARSLVDTVISDRRCLRQAAR
jgi:hypothetical protein